MIVAIFFIIIIIFICLCVHIWIIIFFHLRFIRMCSVLLVFDSLGKSSRLWYAAQRVPLAPGRVLSPASSGPLAEHILSRQHDLLSCRVLLRHELLHVIQQREDLLRVLLNGAQLLLIKVRVDLSTQEYLREDLPKVWRTWSVFRCWHVWFTKKEKYD